jgi:hypothetical protein
MNELSMDSAKNGTIESGLTLTPKAQNLIDKALLEK